MNVDNQNITVITPTTGKDSLFHLIESMTKQGVPICHILLWDNFKEGRFAFQDNERTDQVVMDEPVIMKPSDLDKEEYEKEFNYTVVNIDMKADMVEGVAAGSALRSIGMMAAFTDLVTFADDDIIWDDDHLIQMMESIKDKKWAYCKRKIWTTTNDGQYECLGLDEFESVGEDAKTPYKMIDNNCMMFRRRYGVSAACLYRETKEYNDDRLMYAFLKEYAGEPGQTGNATINQVCPKRLEQFFRAGCTPLT